MSTKADRLVRKNIKIIPKTRTSRTVCVTAQFTLSGNRKTKINILFLLE